MRRCFAALILCLPLLWLYTSPDPVHAGIALESPDCSTPYKATYTWLEWLQRGQRWEPEEAARCFPLSEAGVGRAEAIRRVVKLKEAIDARGYWIALDELSDESGYVDEESGLARVTVVSQVPEVYLEKVDGRWQFSKASLQVAPELYAHTFTFGLDSLIERMPTWLQWTLFGLEGWQYLALVLLIALAFPLSRMLGLVFGRVGGAIFKRAGLSWGQALVREWREPLRLLGAALLVSMILPQLRLPVKASVVLGVAVKMFAAISAVWAMMRLAEVISDVLQERAEGTGTRMDDQLVPLVRKAMKAVIFVVGVVFVLQNAGVDVGSLVAGLGIGGLAFALAARDTLANLFGSLMIFLDRPFQIGDWIVTSGLEGVVEQVGFRSTRIRTFANSLVTAPNSKIADAVIDNMGERTYRRLKTTLGLTYSTTPEQMQAFVEGVRAILKANPAIRQDYYEVHFYNYGAHSLDILVYAFLHVPSWSDELRQRHNIFLEIMRLAREIGVEFAFPTQTLHMESMAKAVDRSPPPVPGDEELAAVVAAFGPEGRLSRPDGPKLTHGYFAGESTEKGSSGE